MELALMEGVYAQLQLILQAVVSMCQYLLLQWGKRVDF